MSLRPPTTIRDYLAQRRAWLNSSANLLPNTVYRVNELEKLVGVKWELELPLTIHGVVIIADVLAFDEGPAVAARVPDPATTRPIRQLTRPYMRGDDVRALQAALQQQGFSGDQDGVFGPMTSVLVKQFQAKRSLPADGVVGPATWQALEISVGAAAR